ncbi:hypothetical protein ACWDSJ_10275 [Nocardia sp. NPDC003482]|uniref:hypothetical protein n=1 Tax=Nocardia sp. NPDC004068 TaxID=3364303 RepID=UPI0036A82816
MGIKEISVAVTEDDWLALSDAADCAGMGVRDYVAWAVRLVALQAKPEVTRASTPYLTKGVRYRVEDRDEPESAAWLDTFAERLSHRAEQFRDEV